MSTSASRGTFCVSIDLELAWGVWDRVGADDLRRAESDEREIVARLLALAARFEIPMTWATVGRVFDENAAATLPAGPLRAWFAPELIDAIRNSPVDHDIGSHSWSHRYFGSLTADEAADELGRDVELRRRWGLPMTSWVFPRNDVGHVDALGRAGVRIYRTHDAGVLDWVRRRAPRAYPAANLLEKILPVVPPTVDAPRASSNAINPMPLASSTLLMGRNGPRALVNPSITIWRWKRALEKAAETSSVFHPWFHPSNFYFDADTQLAILESALQHASRLRDRGLLDVRTMASLADTRAN